MKFKKQIPKFRQVFKKIGQKCFFKFLVFLKFCQIKKLYQIVFIILSKFKKNSLPFLKFCGIYIFYLVDFLIFSNFFTISSKCFHNLVQFFSKFRQIFLKMQVFSNRYDIDNID